MALALSVLDQSPISEGSDGGEALRNSIDLARHVEQLGYGRYWLAEHHGTPMLASAAPEILIAAVAAATERIRVGSGGVMLPHYSPLKVAGSRTTTRRGGAPTRCSPARSAWSGCSRRRLRAHR